MVEPLLITLDIKLDEELLSHELEAERRDALLGHVCGHGRDGVKSRHKQVELSPDTGDAGVVAVSLRPQRTEKIPHTSLNI